jgi:hypothetical protein
MAEEQGTPEAPEVLVEEPGQLPVVEAPTEVEPEPEEDDPKAGLYALLKERPELVDDYLDTLSDEETSKYKALNRRVDKGITKAREKLKQEFSKETAEIQEARTWMNGFQQWADHPDRTPMEVAQTATRYAAEIAKHKATLAKATPNDTQVLITRAEEGFRKTLREAMPDVEDWDNVSSPDDIKERIGKSKEKAVAEAKKELESTWEKKMNAELSKLRAQLNLNADQPDRSSNSGAARGTKQYTWAEVQQMPISQYRENAEEIDKAVAEGRIK